MGRFLYNIFECCIESIIDVDGLPFGFPKLFEGFIVEKVGVAALTSIDVPFLEGVHFAIFIMCAYFLTLISCKLLLLL
jgi:hypothetical protein